MARRQRKTRIRSLRPRPAIRRPYAGVAARGRAWVALAHGNLDGAERVLDEAALALRECGAWSLLLMLYVRSVVAVRRKKSDEAIAHCRQSLLVVRDLDDKFAFVKPSARSGHDSARIDGHARTPRGGGRHLIDRRARIFRSELARDACVAAVGPKSRGQLLIRARTWSSTFVVSHGSQVAAARRPRAITRVRRARGVCPGSSSGLEG